MSDRTSKVLAALVIGVAIVLAAFVLAPPRYSVFAVDDPNGQTVHGVLDARTGRVCIVVIVRELEDDGTTREFLRCAPAID